MRSGAVSEVPSAVVVGGGSSAVAPLLSVADLSVGFGSGDRRVVAVRSASFEVGPGEVVGLVGESGSGKTVTSLAVMGLLGGLGGSVLGRRVEFHGADITRLSERQWLQLRGRKISMIFQQPARALDPAFTVGDQIAEGIRAHLSVSRKEAWRRAVEMLDRVHIANAAARAHDYPHTFSGGMCQRVMIAIALACDPELLIADEPTTALDVTVQSKILDLIEEVRRASGIAVLYITHDLGVVAETCQRVTVMYAGETVEEASVGDLFGRPRHPYTAGLLSAIPRPGRGKRMVAIPGNIPPPHLMPSGCRFHPRCPHAVEGMCDVGSKDLQVTGDGRVTRCVRATDLHLPGVDG